MKYYLDAEDFIDRVETQCKNKLKNKIMPYTKTDLYLKFRNETGMSAESKPSLYLEWLEEQHLSSINEQIQLNDWLKDCMNDGE